MFTHDLSLAMYSLMEGQIMGLFCINSINETGAQNGSDFWI